MVKAPYSRAIHWVMFILIVKVTRVRFKEGVDEIPQANALGNIP